MEVKDKPRLPLSDWSIPSGATGQRGCAEGLSAQRASLGPRLHSLPGICTEKVSCFFRQFAENIAAMS